METRGAVTIGTRCTGSVTSGRQTMRHRFWYWIILAGMLITRLGFNALGADTAALPDLAVTVLLTAGMLTCLLGVTGLFGMLDWIGQLGRD